MKAKPLSIVCMTFYKLASLFHELRLILQGQIIPIQLHSSSFLPQIPIPITGDSYLPFKIQLGLPLHADFRYLHNNY